MKLVYFKKRKMEIILNELGSFWCFFRISLEVFGINYNLGISFVICLIFGLGLIYEF